MSDEHNAVTIVERTPMATRQMHPIVEAAVKSGDVALLREALALHKEHEAHEAKRAFTQALVALKADLPQVIRRDHLVDFGSGDKRVTYRHATLAGVMDAITEPLTRHGFALTYTASNPDGKVNVTCRLTHADGHSETMTLSAANDSGSGRSSIQGIASSITYLQRYSALALLGIATADMPDADDLTGGKPDARIDAARNLKAVGIMARRGIAVSEAEKEAKKSCQDWTGDDLAHLSEWSKHGPEKQA